MTLISSRNMMPWARTLMFITYQVEVSSCTTKKPGRVEKEHTKSSSAISDCAKGARTLPKTPAQLLNQRKVSNQLRGRRAPSEKDMLTVRNQGGQILGAEEYFE